MRFYRSGRWGFALIWGLRASVFPYALALATPNALFAFVIGEFLEDEIGDKDQDAAKYAQSIWVGFTSVLFFVLYFRSNVAYDRWWEGGTLLQKTRGEWFNAYSSLIAFSSMDPKMAYQVEKFHHTLARLMSLLMCSALQQVSPDRNRPLEVIDPTGIEPESLQFLKESSDKVEVILQWIQRSTVLGMQSGVLPIPPPVMSRAFQEVSRGIVNLQNARKIAEFPFPFPYAQTSIVMLLIHWLMMPILSSMLLPKFLSACTCFCVIFFLWCINYIALQLEQPFGSDANDLPMLQMQQDWNKSVGTLLIKRAQRPPDFEFDPPLHRQLQISMSDGSTETARRMTLPAGSMLADGIEPKKMDGSLPPVTERMSMLSMVPNAEEPKSRECTDTSRDAAGPSGPGEPTSLGPSGQFSRDISLQDGNAGGRNNTSSLNSQSDLQRSPTETNVPEELNEGATLAKPFASPAKQTPRGQGPGALSRPLPHRLGDSSAMVIATDHRGGGSGGGGGGGGGGGAGGGGGGSGGEILGGGGGVGHGGGTARASGYEIGMADARWHSLDEQSTVVNLDTIAGWPSASGQRHSGLHGANVHRHSGWNSGFSNDDPHFIETDESHDEARPLAMTAATHAAAPSVLGQGYTVFLDRATDDSLGVEVRHDTDRDAIIITKVGGGLAGRWNDENPGNQIHPGDQILEVNGIQAPVQALLERCRVDEVLMMTLTR